MWWRKGEAWACSSLILSVSVATCCIKLVVRTPDIDFSPFACPVFSLELLADFDGISGWLC